MIGIGIIGSGAIASVHADSYKLYSGRCHVTAVCDTFRDKAEALIAGKALGATAYSDYEALLKDSRVDAVSICLPPGAHCLVAVRALEAGKHVLVEKPMANSLEECDLMIGAARASGRILSVVSQNRFKTPIARLKAMIDGGDIGKVLHANFDSLWWRGQVYYDLWWRGTWEQESGGCFMSHGVHYLDLMHMLFGMPLSVQATIANLAHDNSECEDHGFAEFRYADKLVHFACSLVCHGERQGITVEGEKASLSIPWVVSASRALPNGFPEEDAGQKERLEDRYRSIGELPSEGHDAQILDFLDGIEEGKPVALDGSEGRKTIELIMGIYKSAVTGVPAGFPIAADDAFYRRETMAAAMPKFHQKTKRVDNFSETKITLGRDLGR